MKSKRRRLLLLLRWAGGYGKTTLAKALCHDERIQEAFYDGILWDTWGKSCNLTGHVGDLIEILSGERSGFAGLEAAREDEFRKLLFDFNWMQAKLEATDVNSLISDYDYFLEDQTLHLVQGVIRLSSNALTRDSTQLAGQLIGRLQCFSESDDGIQSMLEQAHKWNGGQWL